MKSYTSFAIFEQNALKIKLSTILQQMLNHFTLSLIKILENENSSEEQIQAAAQQFLSQAVNSNPSEVEVALKDLSSTFFLKNVNRAGFAAVAAGYLIERGVDPSPIESALIERLEHFITLSADFARECHSRFAAKLEEDEDADPNELFEEHRPQVEAEMPLEAEAWNGLEAMWCGGIALFSKSKRARANAQYLRKLTAQSAEYHIGTHWLDLILSVLDDEPFIAIERETLNGFMGKMSGVVENFQLHVLLMDAFPQGWFSGKRISKTVAEIVKGLGEQTSDETVKGAWNMYDWTAVGDDLSLPEGTNKTESWIWGEGRPEDIPIFEGYRVILLGKSAYERSWRAQRMFSKLEAELKIEQKFTREDSSNWLKKMAQQPK